MVAAADRQHRYRPDHPGALPEDDFEGGPRATSSSATGATTPTGNPKPDFILNQPEAQGRADSAGRRQLRLRQLARARAVGADAVRLPRRDQHLVRRHLQGQLAEEFAAADRRAAGRSRRAVRRRPRRHREDRSAASDADHCPTAARSSSRSTRSPSTACSKASTNWATS